MEAPKNTADELLIVEDSTPQGLALQAILESSGYKTFLAKNGNEALTYLLDRNPSIVITDVVMPDMDGFELCRKIKDVYKETGPSLIILTHLSNIEDIMRGLEAGADSFVTKPYRKDALLSCIRTVQENRKAGRLHEPAKDLEVCCNGKTYQVRSDGRQMLEVLLSIYEAAAQKNRELAQAQKELRTLNANLEERVLDRTAALEAEITERKWAQNLLRELNEQLEQKVQERTAAIESEIEERKWVEQQLQAKNQELEKLSAMKSEFVATVSHELRTPLTVVISTIRNFLDGVLGELSDVQKKRLAKIHHHATRLNHMINDILDLSKLESGTAAIRCEPLDMAAVIKAVVSHLQELVAEKQQTLTCEIEDKLPLAWASSGKMEQVLVNLINNAKKFTPEGGRIHVKAALVNGTVEVRVQDTGPGIPKEHLQSVFDRFKQIRKDKEEGNSTKGIGLGLAICAEIVQQHHGRIWVESELGQGATFIFQVPAHAVEACPRSILIVEDEVELCKVLERNFKEWGYQVACSNNGEEAIRHVQDANVRYDCVLVDLLLPGANGGRVIQAVRETAPQTHLAVLTAYPNSEMLKHQSSDKPLTILPKPFKKDELRVTVDSLVGK